MGRSRRERDKREGSVLGLGDAGSSIINRESGRPSRSSETEESKRRRRMSEGADELTPSVEGMSKSGGHGATGIDMGAGGGGTDIE
jgi:hypothetical protein